MFKMAVTDKWRYPIGTFAKPDIFSKEIMMHYIQTIADFPDKLKKEVLHLTEAQLNTPYRFEGWTIRQVVHHCADSHMNAFIRCKLALTENQPVIKPYQEDRWAELTDSKNMPIDPSLIFLDALHTRWVVLLQSLTEEDFERAFVHPEHGKTIQLKENTGMYAWHCNHHLAHITALKKAKEWK